MSHPTKLSIASLAMLLFAATLWPSLATADEITEVLVDTSSANCPEVLADDFIRELELRTSADMLTPETAEDDVAHILTLHSGDEELCELRLENSANRWTLIVDRNANRPELASAANRMAWILDGVDVPKSQVATEPVTDNDESTLATDEPPAVTELEPTGEPLRRTFSVDAAGGAMWVPAAEDAVALIRARAGWMPRSNLHVGLTGRLPMRPLITTRGDVTHSYRPWAVGLNAGYARQLGDRFFLSVDGGLRRTIPHLTATAPTQSNDSSTNTPDDPNGGQQPNTIEAGNHITNQQQERENRADAEDVRHDDEVRDERPGVVTNEPDSSIPEALISWAAVTHASLHYGITSDLALRFDTGVAFGLSDRSIRDDQGVIMNLGRLEIDMLLGIDLRF